MPPTKNKRKITLARTLFGLFCILMVLVAVLMVRIQPPRAAQSVQVITSDWQPYVDTTVDQGGTVGEIVVSVLASSGYNGQVTFDTWSSGLERVDQGTAFGIFPMVKSASRDETYEYSDPLVDYKYVLFKRRSMDVPDSVLSGDLSGMRVGVIDGYDYWHELDDSGATFKDYPTTAAGFQALSNDEVDFVAESDIVGNATIKGQKFEGDANEFGIVRGDNPALSSTDSVYFLIRKSELSDAVMEKFNKALAEYKKTERYGELVETLEGTNDEVILTSESLIDVRSATGDDLGAVPPGITAWVLEWPADLKPGAMLKIKMLNGPLSGRIGLVRLQDVEVNNV